MQPYYQTHPIGVLYLLAVTGWYLMEVAAYRAHASSHKRLVPLGW
jgi:hypothetical protein